MRDKVKKLPRKGKDIIPPASVTIPAIIVLFMTAWNFIRIYSVIINWQILVEFGASPNYILATGIIWALIGLWLIVVLWQERHFAARAGSAVTGCFFLWYWVDRLTIQPSPAPNVLFSIIFSTCILATIIISLHLPALKSFFNKE